MTYPAYKILTRDRDPGLHNQTRTEINVATQYNHMATANQETTSKENKASKKLRPRTTQRLHEVQQARGELQINPTQVVHTWDRQPELVINSITAVLFSKFIPNTSKIYFSKCSELKLKT